jgi:4-hydroxy-tetrahydrodipicolinate synthase
MKKLLPLRGIITVLNTPFTKENEIDYSAVKKHLAYAIEAGVVGILVPAMATEVGKLTFQERKLLVQTVLEASNDQISVIGGASAQNNDDRITIAKELINIGCNGVLVNIPYTTENAFRSAIEPIAGLDPPFLMIQDWSFEGYGLPLKLILELFHEYDTFRAIKIEVVPAGVKYSEVLEATEGKLHVSGGWAVQSFIEALDRGVHAFMPTGMHEIYTRIYSLYQKGDRDAALRLFEKIQPVLAFSNQHLDISIHFFKRLLWRQGIYPTPNVREPILPFDEIHVQHAEYHINNLLEIMKKIYDNDYS